MEIRAGNGCLCDAWKWYMLLFRILSELAKLVYIWIALGRIWSFRELFYFNHALKAFVCSTVVSILVQFFYCSHRPRCLLRHFAHVHRMGADRVQRSSAVFIARQSEHDEQIDCDDVFLASAERHRSRPCAFALRVDVSLLRRLYRRLPFRCDADVDAKSRHADVRVVLDGSRLRCRDRRSLHFWLLQCHGRTHEITVRCVVCFVLH